MARRRARTSRRSSKSRGRYRKAARSTKRGRSRGRSSARRGRGRSKSYRRNPVGQLRDGSMITVEGRSVTITSKYGETYEYDEVSGTTLRALISAKTFKAAQRACNKSGVLRSINPKRGKRTGKKSRRWTYGATRKLSRSLRGKGKAEKAWPFNRRHKGHGRRSRARR